MQENDFDKARKLGNILSSMNEEEKNNFAKWIAKFFVELDKQGIFNEKSLKLINHLLSHQKD